MSVKLSTRGQREAFTFDRPHLLMVEGGDDQAATSALLTQAGLGVDWQILDMGGKNTDWPGLLGIALDSPKFQAVGRSVGLVQDADLDPSAALQRMKNVLGVNGLSFSPNPGGIDTSGPLKVGIFVMPGAGKTGSLEDLLVQALEPQRIALATEYVNKVVAEVEPVASRSKALVQTYLAALPRVVRTLPAAFKHREVIPIADASFDAYTNFLRALCSD